MTFCFGKPIDAVDAPDFAAPILVAMDASSPVFVCFKYSDLYKNMIMKCPPNLSKIMSPATAGLVDLQQVGLSFSYTLPIENQIPFIAIVSDAYSERQSLTLPSSSAPKSTR